MRASRLTFLMPVATMVACGGPEFEVVGIKVESTTLEVAYKMHPRMDCEYLKAFGLRPMVPDYKHCRVEDVEVANIRSSLNLEPTKDGVITAVVISGQPYDGPFISWSKAMNEKYGSGTTDEQGRIVWKGTNGRATLEKGTDGGARLYFTGNRWQQDVEEATRNMEKGRKF